MDQLDEIRSKVDIVKLVSEYVSVKPAGRNFKALCPFHPEKTPSFMVSSERQIFKCFGCGAGGDVFQFLMRIEGLEFGEALRNLAQRTGVKLTSYKPSSVEQEKERLYKINYLASEFYYYLLVYHPIGREALRYLMSQRGIKKETIKLFRIGYAPSNWDSLQRFLVNKKGYSAQDLLKAGLITGRNNSYRDFFRQRLVFPLKDHRGHIVGFSGRVIGEWHQDAKTGPKYLNSPETLIYHKGDLLYGLETAKSEIKAANHAILVEGEFDLLSSFQAGIKNIVAIKGSALTEYQVKLLRRFCENVIFALDKDLSGDAAMRRGTQIADDLGLNVAVANLVGGKDPDELASKNPAGWKKVIDSTIPIYDFFLQSALNRFDVTTAVGKRKIGEEILPIFAKISNEIVKAHYLRELAEKLAIPPEAILNQAGKMAIELPKQPTVSTSQKIKRSHQEVLEEYLFALAFQSDEPQFLIDPSVKTLIKTLAATRIIDCLEEFSLKKKKFNSQEFTKLLPAELLDIFNNAYLFDFDQQIADPNWVTLEREKILFELQKHEIQEKLKAISLKMNGLDEKKNSEEFEELKKKFLRLSQKLVKLA